jgi:small subunit ribosomal protein S2
MRDITVVDMLKSGLHFGHQQSRRHPKMDPFIFTTRGGVSIINLEKAKASLTQACAYVKDVVASGGEVVFVATKRQARDIVQQAAQTAGMPYVVDRWIGGLFTNFQHVRQLIVKLDTLKSQRASGELEKYTKKEQLDFEEEIARLEKLVGGLGKMERLPQAVFVVDIKVEKTAVREANAMKIPVVAMCDTNVNPANIQYPIPANDDATKAITYVTGMMVEAVAEGRQANDQRLAKAARDAAAAAAAAEINVPALDIPPVPESTLDE